MPASGTNRWTSQAGEPEQIPRRFPKDREVWGDMYIPLTLDAKRVRWMIRNHEDLMKADGRCAFAVFDFRGGEFISTKGKPWLVAAAKKQEVTQ